MKNLVLLVLMIIIVTGCNYSKKNAPTNNEAQHLSIELDTTPRVTGIGGIFFSSEDPQKMKDWYGDNLGLAIDQYGSPFEFRNANAPEEINYLMWSPVKGGTNFFAPSKKELIINYRVNNIEGLVRKLEANGATMIDTIASYEYGKFVHLLDLEGNKIELWEPIDSVLTKIGGATTK